MIRVASLPLLVWFAAQGTAPAPMPSIENGPVERHDAASLDRELSSLMTSPAPIWAGWRVPMIEERSAGCCSYSDETSAIRGCALEGLPAIGAPPASSTTASVALEGGTGLVVLVRIADGHIERLRTLSDDCPLDAGGRTFHWLQGVSPTDSLHFLEGLIAASDRDSTARATPTADSALNAIALHRDAGADVVIDRVARGESDVPLRRTARALLGSSRGAHGFGVLRQLINAERLPAMRRPLATSLGHTREPATSEVLLALATHDVDAGVRGEAAYWLPQLGRERAVADVLEIVRNDSSDAVKGRAVQGLGRVADATVTRQLIALARENPNLAVRKAAVTALGRSADPQAVAFVEELIRQ